MSSMPFLFGLLLTTITSSVLVELMAEGFQRAQLPFLNRTTDLSTSMLGWPTMAVVHVRALGCVLVLTVLCPNS